MTRLRSILTSLAPLVWPKILLTCGDAAYHIMLELLDAGGPIDGRRGGREPRGGFDRTGTAPYWSTRSAGPL